MEGTGAVLDLVPTVVVAREVVLTAEVVVLTFEVVVGRGVVVADRVAVEDFVMTAEEVEGLTGAPPLTIASENRADFSVALPSNGSAPPWTAVMISFDFMPSLAMR